MQSITPPLIAVIGSDGSGSQRCVNISLPLSKNMVLPKGSFRKTSRKCRSCSDKITVDGKSLHKTIERNQVKTAKKLPALFRRW